VNIPPEIKYITLCIIHPSIWKSSSSPNPCSSCHSHIKWSVPPKITTNQPNEKRDRGERKTGKERERERERERESEGEGEGERGKREIERTREGWKEREEGKGGEGEGGKEREIFVDKELSERKEREWQRERGRERK
jgi:hypothetical protein